MPWHVLLARLDWVDYHCYWRRVLSALARPTEEEHRNRGQEYDRGHAKPSISFFRGPCFAPPSGAMISNYDESDCDRSIVRRNHRQAACCCYAGRSRLEPSRSRL